MLFADPANANASISITLDREQYLAGDTINGSLTITAKKPIECTSIVVVATGVETVNWSDSSIKSIIKNEEKECFWREIRIPLSQKTYEPGQYVKTFTIMVPETVPGSFNLPAMREPFDLVKYTRASIEYKLEATVDFLAVENPPRLRTCQLRARKDFELHEVHSNIEARPRENEHLKAPVRASCCRSYGTCDFKVSIAEDVAFIGDRVQVQVDFNNASSAIIPAITCHLIQVTKTKMFTFDNTVERKIGSWMYREIPAHEHVVRPHVFKVEATETDQVLYPPIRNGSLVQSSYLIRVDAYIKGSTDFELQLPLTVVSALMKERQAAVIAHAG